MDGLILRLIKYAFYLGVAGQLVDATIAMRGKAFEASSHGLVSLRALNHALMGPKAK